MHKHVNNSQKLDSIQVLRGIAALSVVLFHYRFWLAPLYGDLTIPNKYLGWGAGGVDLFFVISGFIMVYITSKKPSGIKGALFFITERLTRILPTYYIILFTAFYFTWEIGVFTDPKIIANLISALTFLPNTTDYPPLYVDASGLYVVRWTLNYELYFYAVFGICILLNKKLPILIGWIICSIIAGVYFTSKLTFETSGYKIEPPLFSFLTNPIIIEFFIGALAGYTYQYLQKSSDKIKRGFALISIIIVGLGFSYGFIQGWNVGFAVILYFVVVTFALFNDFITKYTPSFFIMLGNISFSWYLLHNQVASYISWQVEANNPGVMHSTLGFFSLLAISILLAYISHKLLEVWLTNKIRDAIFSSPLGKFIDLRKVKKEV